MIKIYKILLVNALVFLTVVLNGQKNHLLFRFPNLQVDDDAKTLSKTSTSTALTLKIIYRIIWE